MRSLLDLGIEPPPLAIDTAIAAYLIDPAETAAAVADLLLKATPGPACRSTIRRRPASSTSATTACRTSSARLDSPSAPIASRPCSIRRLERQGMAELYRAIENPLVSVLPVWSTSESGSTPRNPATERHPDRRGQPADRGLDRHGRAAVQPQLLVQLREILYTERGLTPVKKTKTGYRPTLRRPKPRDQWPEFIDPLLRYREVEKPAPPTPKASWPRSPDGRIHATFNQTVARTGRLSSDQPNLHNIPVRSEGGRAFRKAFVAAPGSELLIADYNQIELRCIAHLAADPGLIGAFTSGQDIHNATAARVFGVEANAVTVEQRSKAKMVSYGLAYGWRPTARPTAEHPDRGSRRDPRRLLRRLPNVKAYMERTVAEARARPPRPCSVGGDPFRNSPTRTSGSVVRPASVMR
ncbi:MAG: DNA polymerase [Ilumatobacteraceae bacterium]